jgi:RNA polymerase sigma factor (sigma-70 family)
MAERASARGSLLTSIRRAALSRATGRSDAVINHIYRYVIEDSERFRLRRFWHGQGTTPPRSDPPPRPVRTSDPGVDPHSVTGQPESKPHIRPRRFAAALVGVSGFRPELGSAQGWLFAIARHQLADAFERGRVENRARRRLGIEPLALRDELLERIDELGDGDEALRLLAELPEDQRLAVQGRVVEERDYTELASSLRCSESVVRQRVSRGLRALRRAMKEPT